MNEDIFMFNGITIPVKVSEGAISIKNSVSVRGDKLEPILATPVTQGEAVALIGITDDGYPLVEYANGSNGVIIGFVHDHPEYDNDPVVDYTKAQAITAGMLRKCGVETTFTDIRAVNVKTGEGITAGDYVKYGADGQKFEKSSTATNMIALSNQGSTNRINIGIQ